MQNVGIEADPLSRELNRQPEDADINPGRWEDAEKSRRKNEDAATAELNIRPEYKSPADEDDSHAITQGNKDNSALRNWKGGIDTAHHWAWITIFSILGTLTRVGLQSLNDYSGHLIPPLVWAQFVGCLVMGFLTEDDKMFPKKGEKYDALYIGLTVGYCGSTTSFSAWILQIYEDLANTEDYQRPRGYNVISIFTQVMVTLGASIAAFRLGNHLAIFADHLFTLKPIPNVKRTSKIILLILIAIGFQAGSIITAGIRRDWRGIIAFAMVFSPAGALTRWYLSRNLNGIAPTFPLGTFAANMIGSLLESIFHLLQYHVSNGNACAVLQGLQDGYCGALSTVSTFMVELCTLKRGHAYRYAITSIVLGSVLYILVDGIDYWTHGSAHDYRPICTY